jgi:hypothetical protein
MKLVVAAVALAYLLALSPVRGQDFHPNSEGLYPTDPPKAGETPRLTYVVEPAKDAPYSRTCVTLTFRGDASGRSKLVLPPGWFGGDSEAKALRDLRVLSPGARLGDSTQPGIKEVTHRPNEEVTVAYAIDQAPPAGAGRSSPPKPYFYHFGEALWVLPDWDKKKPISFVLQWKNFPGHWTLSNSYGSGDCQKFLDTIERFQHGTYVGGDFRLRPFRVGSKTVLLAVRGQPAFTERGDRPAPRSVAQSLAQATKQGLEEHFFVLAQPPRGSHLARRPRSVYRVLDRNSWRYIACVAG